MLTVVELLVPMAQFQLFHANNGKEMNILMPLIISSITLLVLLLLLNAFINSIFGFDKNGQYGKVLEGSFTIGFLYLIIIQLFGNNLSMIEVPFIDKIYNYGSFTEMFKNERGLFAIECAELISLTFVIYLISDIISDSWIGSTFTGKVIRSIIVVLIAMLANHYFLITLKKTIFFYWSAIAIQCFFSGVSLTLTPAMVLGKLLNIEPESEIVSFLIKKLPETKVGKAISTATTNSVLLVLVVLILESQFGSMTTIVKQTPQMISLFIPIGIMLVGIRLIIKSAAK